MMVQDLLELWAKSGPSPTDEPTSAPSTLQWLLFQLKLKEKEANTSRQTGEQQSVPKVTVSVGLIAGLAKGEYIRNPADVGASTVWSHSVSPGLCSG